MQLNKFNIKKSGVALLFGRRIYAYCMTNKNRNTNNNKPTCILVRVLPICLVSRDYAPWDACTVLPTTSPAFCLLFSGTCCN